MLNKSRAKNATLKDSLNEAETATIKAMAEKDQAIQLKEEAVVRMNDALICSEKVDVEVMTIRKVVVSESESLQ